MPYLIVEYLNAKDFGSTASHHPIAGGSSSASVSTSKGKGKAVKSYVENTLVPSKL
jgi:hypothetical protein